MRSRYADPPNLDEAATPSSRGDVVSHEKLTTTMKTLRGVNDFFHNFRKSSVFSCLGCLSLRISLLPPDIFIVRPMINIRLRPFYCMYLSLPEKRKTRRALTQRQTMRFYFAVLQMT